MDNKKYLISIYGSHSNDKDMEYVYDILTRLKYDTLIPKLDTSGFTTELSIKGLLYSSMGIIDKSDICIFIGDDLKDKTLIQLGYAFGCHKPIIGIYSNNPPLSATSLYTYHINLNDPDISNKLTDVLSFIIGNTDNDDVDQHNSSDSIVATNYTIPSDFWYDD